MRRVCRAAIIDAQRSLRYIAISQCEINRSSRRLRARTKKSSRRLTRDTGRFVRETPGSRSLERGLMLLRAFRVGGSLLTNADLAERSGLPRPTVSRLARSLVDSGFLAYDMSSRAYRLTAVFLNLARVFRDDVPALDLALPLMKAVAEGESINVGLAVPDQYEMIYLESVRESRRGIFRRIVPGSRTPMEATSLGRSYLYTLETAARQKILRHIAAKYTHGWDEMQTQIDKAFAALASKGYCVAAWQHGMMAMATPLKAPDQSRYALNLSFPSTDAEANEAQVARYAPKLLQLAKDITRAWEARDRERL